MYRGLSFFLNKLNTRKDPLTKVFSCLHQLIMTDTEITYLPLPPTELMQGIHHFEFLQNSLTNSSTIQSFKAMTYTLSTRQLVNGWEQQHQKVHRLKIDSALSVLKSVSVMVEGAMDLAANDDTNNGDDAKAVELLRLRFNKVKELFVIPDSSKDLGLIVVITRSIK